MSGSLSNLELERLIEDMGAEFDQDNIGKFYRNSPNTQGVQVSSDGTVSTPTPTTIYEGTVEFTTIEARRDRYETRLGEHVYLKQYRVNIPSSATTPIENDRFEMTVCPADPQLVGRVMIVKDVHYDGQLSKRRITVVDTDE